MRKTLVASKSTAIFGAFGVRTKHVVNVKALFLPIDIQRT